MSRKQILRLCDQHSPAEGVPQARCQLHQPYRGVLALQAGAVEAQSVDTGRASRDVKEALVPTLARLWLRQVPGSEGDGLHHTHWHVDLSGGQDLRAVLGVTRLQLSVEGASEQGVPHCGPDCNLCAEPVLLLGKHHCAHFIHWKTEDLRNSQMLQRQEAWVLHLSGYVAALCALGQALPPLGSVCSNVLGPHHSATKRSHLVHS